MPDIFAGQHKFTVTPAVSGTPIGYGNTGDENQGGAWTFELAPDLSFDGSFVVVGRTTRVQSADSPLVPWMPIPYRRITLGNVASDYAMVSDQITNAMLPALIQVPSNGMQVGLDPVSTQGSCAVYGKLTVGAQAV